MSESSNIDFFTKLDWTKSTEDLLISWADIALCYTWIFDKSYRHYNHVNYRFTIPVIVFSTITGTLSMSFGNLLNEDQAKTGQIIVGGVNIFIGILSTLQNFFRYAQQSEANLSATRDWAKLHRNIKIELSIERQNRKDASEFVRSARQEYERLLNSRPVIPSNIMMDFKKQYRNSDVIKPEVLDKIRHIILDDEKNIITHYVPRVDENRNFLTRMSSFIQKTNPFSPRNSDISIETSTPPVSRSITPDDVTPVQITRKISINIPDDQTKQLHHNIDCVIEEEQELEEEKSEKSEKKFAFQIHNNYDE
jgi:hypothetical protein